MNSLYEQMLKTVNRELSNLHTSLVARVTVVNEDTINCQPVVSRMVNGQKIDLPEFASVPVVFSYGGSSHHSFPVSVGDYCLLFVSERCFDYWYEGMDNFPPALPRMFDYSDSFALVGVQPKAKAITIPDVITQIGDTHIEGNYDHQGNYVLDGNLTVNGNVLVNGNITCTGTLTVPVIAVGSFTAHPDTSQTPPSIDKIVVNSSAVIAGVEHAGHRHNYSNGTTEGPI